MMESYFVKTTKSARLTRMMRFIVIPVFTVLLITLFEYAGFFKGMSNYFYDLFFRVRGAHQPDPSILIVGIDENTLKDLGRWPIQRLYYIQLLDKLRLSKVVAFDIILSEPGSDDHALAQAIKDHGKVILPVYIDKNLNIAAPLEIFSPLKTGHVHIEQDVDGVVRKVFHTIYLKERILPSFSSVIYETIIDTSYSRQSPSSSEQKHLSSESLEQHDMMRINYYGNPATFPYISLSNIIEGQYSPEFFKDKIILVGLTAEGLEDKILTPFSQLRNRTSGVEVHANIVNNLLNYNDIKVNTPWIQWLSFIMISFVCSFLFLTISEGRATWFWIFIILLITLYSFTFFTHLNLWISPVEYYFLVTFPAVTAYIVRLNDAAHALDREYSTIVNHMRWKTQKKDVHASEKGIYGFLTRGGINSKIRILSQITDQFLFEKSLTDTALYSDIHGVMLFNDKGELIIANTRAQNLFSTEPTTLTNLSSFTHSIFPLIMEKEDINEALTKMEENGYQGISFTLSLTSPQKIFLKMDITSLLFINHKYLLFVLTDITKIKELELLKGKIVSIVSHELKAPISSIQGFSELLIQSVEGKLKTFAQIINDESHRLIRLVNTFLDISRIESGGQEISIIPTDIITLIKNVIPAIEPVARNKNMIIKVDTPNFITPLLIDTDLTHQCMVNLIENAIKYSPSDSDVRIKVTEQEDFIQVDIIDKGYGINDEEKDKIFDKFYRTTSVVSSKEKGSGLGLAFVKKAVEAQQGHISVTSIPEKGSTFSLTFPKVH